MKKEDLQPDQILVDGVLRGLLKLSRSRKLTKNEARFAVTALKDGEGLSWEEGQFERRRRAVRAVLSEQLTESWRRDKVLSQLFSNQEDELFKRKGWNRVDSGFSLWGKSQEEDFPPEKDSVDRFLSSHGWNDVDSGFRVL